MSRQFAHLAVGAAACAMLAGGPTYAAEAANAQVERGQYLVSLGGCNDCHTPGALQGQPDMKRILGGSDVGFAIPGLGVFVPPNLTPDQETGLGNWTAQQIVTAITTGTRPDGRILAPIMPWMGLSHLTKEDAMAIAVYLKSLPAVSHKAAGPFGPTQKPTVPVMAIVPAEEYVKLTPPPAPAAK